MRFKLSTIALLAISSIASAKDGTYISGNVGIGGLGGTRGDKFDAGFRGGVAFGYDFNDSFALEFNLQHQSNNVKGAKPSALFNHTAALVNGYYFIPGLDKLKPYIGLGLGYGVAYIAQPATSGNVKYFSDSVIVQGLLGARYELTSAFVFADVTYGYSEMTKAAKYTPYGLRLGAGYKF